MSVLRPDLMMRCCIPIIMAGIIAVSVLLDCYSFHFFPLPMNVCMERVRAVLTWSNNCRFTVW
ncbi:hypothetical protein PILCRDRAFT_827843 [Piloderma croceum F 1598]|uniref:Uncharacterized protein n=1 Tax=Piloderma croceum (strain F 1598) TaxID=765440 RepID=A0A0C3F418_PILCF|nr:hypothetical protein PILCRDRAFT_827843 [Piloderma croceum F 1598]